MFVYQADTYCDSCGLVIRANLRAMNQSPEDESDERSYDSDDFPKRALEESTDGPDHCASVSDCMEAVDLSDYGLASDATLYGAEVRSIGALLSDGLTEYGVSYLREMLEDDQGLTPYQAALHRYWREVFADELAT